MQAADAQADIRRALQHALVRTGTDAYLGAGLDPDISKLIECLMGRVHDWGRLGRTRVRKGDDAV